MRETNRRIELSTYAVKFSLKNLVIAVLESPQDGPYPKIGRVLGSGVEVRNKTITPDHFDPDASNFGEKVIVFTQGR